MAKKILFYAVMLLFILSSSVINAQMAFFIQGGAGKLKSINDFTYGWVWNEYPIDENGSITYEMKNSTPIILGVEKSLSDSLGIFVSIMHSKNSVNVSSNYTLKWVDITNTTNTINDGDVNESSITLSSVNMGIFNNIRLNKLLKLELILGISFTKIKPDIHGFIGSAYVIDNTLDYFMIEIFLNEETSKIGGFGGINLDYRINYNLSFYLFTNYYFIPEIKMNIKNITGEIYGKFGNMILPLNDENFISEGLNNPTIAINPSMFVIGAGIKLYF